MGIGLRFSINYRAHDGQLSAENNSDYGANSVLTSVAREHSVDGICKAILLILTVSSKPNRNRDLGSS